MKFEVEWLDAPGVKDRVLAATWARLRISAGDVNVTELLHLASDTRRSSVYGPVFPLVEWIVENWWHLVHEPSPISPLKGGREAPGWLRPWVQRHNLIVAREGMALPDTAIVRDGDEVVVRCFPDFDTSEHQRVQFVGSGQARVPVAEFEKMVAEFVNSTLQRLVEKIGDDEDVRRLSEAWQEIQSADSGEQRLCRYLALLGADPYDPEEATDTLVEQIENLSETVPDVLLNDLLESVQPATIGLAAAWLERSRTELTIGSAEHTYPTIAYGWASSAHQTGYQVARQVRAELLGVDPDEPIEDLQSILVEILGWDSHPIRKAEALPSVNGLLGLSKESSKLVLLNPGGKSGSSERFLLARGVFFAVADMVDQGRLLTSAATPHQRAGKAFAAELLAPASALAKEASGVVPQDDVLELSEKYGVSAWLIQYQLENHKIGYVVA